MTSAATSRDESSRRLLATGERELQRIVLDMHDGPVQDMFAAVSQLQLLERELHEEPALARRAGQAIGLLERALTEVRTIIGVFRPPGFERRPLSAILEGMTVQHETLTDQPVELSLEEGLADPPLPIKIALYRILQEALANGYRHARATRQTVRIEQQGSNLTLTVADNGRGFDPVRVLAAEADVGVEGGHFGLRGIQDRVGMLGGDFSVDSAPGQGTVLRVTVPLS